MKIFYAEDNVKLRDAVLTFLGGLGHEVHSSESGLGVLKRLKAGEHCDLVLADQNMPYMTGVELLRALRSAENFRNVPIVIYTSDESVEEEVVRHGGIYVLKSATPRPLLTALETIAARLASRK